MSRVKKVTLIEPRPPGYHVYSHIALPRLGLPLLGAMLKQSGIDVSIYCEDFHDIDYADVLSSDVVGISTTTSTAPGAYRIADRVQAAGIPLLMGGSHVSFLPDEALNHADFVIRGEGEYTLMEIIDAIEKGSGYGGIRGLSYRIGNEIRHNPDRELVSNLDELPFPDLSLIHGKERIRVSPISTSRGCPFGCSFCSVIHMFGRQYRLRSVPSVIEELRQLDAKQLFFYDDNFTAQPERTKTLLEAMIRENLVVPWTAQARVDVARDRELLNLMKRTDCQMLYIGFESTNPATLEEFHKKQSVEEIVESVRILHEHGIMTHGMFVFGSDSDTVDDLRSTTQFALRNKIDTIQFMILTPFPGTPFFKDIESQDRLLTRDWHLYDGQHVVFEPFKMSAYELQKEAFKAMKRFYSLKESIKMLLGMDIWKLAARLNYNLLSGRWHMARRQFHVALLRWFYRGYANMLIRRWEAANKDFGAIVSVLAQKARRLKEQSKASVGKTK